MDLSKYINLKSANVVSLVMVNDTDLQITSNTYDPDTGQLIGTHEQTNSVEAIKTRIANLQSEIDSLNALLADQVTLPVPQIEPAQPLT